MTTMEAISTLKQLIQRKQKKYKLAIGDHLVNLHKALDGDTKQKLQQLAQRSIDITVPDDYDDTRTAIDGFKVANLPNSRLEERIILIQSDTKQQVARGSIVGVGQNCEVKIKLDKPLALARNVDEAGSTCSINSNASVFKIEFDKRDILNRKNRIENSLRKFEHVACSLPLHRSLLGNYKDLSNKKFQKSRTINLNDSLGLKGSQLKAVEQSMRKRISLIEGVAGSGKTLVAASLAYSMCRYRSKRILLCSPIQATVDKLAQLLTSAEGDVRVVKLGEKREAKETIKSDDRRSSGDNDSDKPTSSSNLVEDCTLESMIRAEIYKRSWLRTERLSSLSCPKTSHNRRVLLHKQANRLVNNSSSWLKKNVERKILQKADIICCTLVQAGSPCLKGLNFDMLIIDDLQAAPETDCMIPMMVKGLKQVTLISEMRREIRSARSKQCHSSKVKLESDGAGRGSLRKKKANRSLGVAEFKNRELVVKQAQEPGGLFERFLSMGLSAVELRNQFRMHETLAAFSNHHFYLSSLKTDKKTNKELTRQICNDLELNNDSFNWLPNSRCLTAFFDTSKNGSSVDETVRNITNRLVSDENVHKSRIGIIIDKHSARATFMALTLVQLKIF